MRFLILGRSVGWMKKKVKKKVEKLENLQRV